MKYDDAFLKLLEKTLDDKQYKALTQEGNTVIAAGAGSGKTQVLATRFAWLVLTGQAEAPQILTLTFTNKAASEMYQRIYDTLKYFSEHEECKELSAIQIQRAKKALEDFSDTHIQTLDSYCSSIVRQCANRYGIKPDFVTGSGDGERLVKDAAFKFILQHAENPAVQAFSNPGEIQNFAENVFATIILKYTSLATQSGFFKESLKSQTKKICDAWNETILADKDGTILNQTGVIQSELEVSSKKDDDDKALYVAQLNKLFETVGLINELPKITSSDIESKSDLIKLSIQTLESVFDEVNKTQGMRGKIQDVGKQVTKLKDLIKSNMAILSFIKDYDILLELNNLLDSFLDQINTQKRTSGNLSFADVTELALIVLLENEDIRNQEKRAYRKIMIDEFQDNNGKNRDLLYLLALKDGEFEDKGKCSIDLSDGEPLYKKIVDKRVEDKLFFVGDEKQSIYKFRGADVTVFNELTQGGENNLVYMTYNYRSDAPLVKAFNTFFKDGNGIFEAFEGVGKTDYEAYYEKDAAKYNEELPELTEENIPIHCCLVNKDELAANDKELPENRKAFLPDKEQKAYFIAKKIKELHDKGVAWSDIAILDRSRTDRGPLTRYLSLFSVPYTVDAVSNIFEDGIVNDFYNFLRICVYPSDVKAFAAFLCSPLAGLSENSMEIIISQFPKQVNQNELDEAEYKKYLKALSFYKELKAQVLRQRLTTTLSYLWNDCGYKYETMLDKNIMLYAEQYDMLFELARQADESGKSPSWFIDQLELIKTGNFFGSDSDLDASGVSYPLEREDAVQIMTIHKSKGLQFKHVFIYGIVGINSKNDSAAFFFDEESGVSIKTDKEAGNYFYNRGKELADKKELAEFRRIIYVAVTRAISSVYIVGSIADVKNSTSSMRLIENMVLRYYPDGNDSPFVPEAGFDFSYIDLVEYSDLPSENTKAPEELRKLVEEKAAGVYENALLIENVSHPVLRKTPSSLENAGLTVNSGAAVTSGLAVTSGAAADTTLPGTEPDKELLRYEENSDLLRSADFTAADFGTLVHAYLEMQALGVGVADYEPETKYFKNLSEAEIKKTKEECIKFCNQFAASDEGKIFSEAKACGRFWRAEWGFRMFWKCADAPEGAIFTGSIDLIYENDDKSYTICDYKSDTTINPEMYRRQQECYRAAASKMLGISEEKIILKLYYLRHNETVKL